tara:strand:+ start:122 stop:505 length:384 start_codon:yes stop_codon:yes gene_type:complete
MSTTFETSIAFIQLLEDGIIRVKVKENAIIDQLGLSENLAIYKQILGNKKAKFITLFHALNTADFGIRSDYEAVNRVELKLAEAFVLASLSNRIEVNYHIQNTKKKYPTKLFNDEHSALKWLRSLKF